MKVQAHSYFHSHTTENLRLILRYSFIVAIVFSMIFILAKILHLESKTELRFINYIMLFPITFAGLKKGYRQNDYKMEYFTGISMAFLICALGQLWYSILFFIY